MTSSNRITPEVEHVQRRARTAINTKVQQAKPWPHLSVLVVVAASRVIPCW